MKERTAYQSITGSLHATKIDALREDVKEALDHLQLVINRNNDFYVDDYFDAINVLHKAASAYRKVVNDDSEEEIPF